MSFIRVLIVAFGLMLASLSSQAGATSPVVYDPFEVRDALTVKIQDTGAELSDLRAQFRVATDKAERRMLARDIRIARIRFEQLRNARQTILDAPRGRIEKVVIKFELPVSPSQTHNV